MKITLKEGDKVRIIGNAPPDKYGAIGVIKTIFSNGAIIALEKGRFTPVKFQNLELVSHPLSVGEMEDMISAEQLKKE